MVFSSVPAYLDPSNWQPQHINHQIIGSNATNPLLPPAAPPPPHGGPGSGSGSIRPGSMSERARLANIPMPEAALKCPRCESTNTKFCYFNNYSLSQPRHFCKTCRRYWTRGGALRSVPVGGGCRRNKRSKSTSASKSSPASSDGNKAHSGSTSGANNTVSNNYPTNNINNSNNNNSNNLLNLTPPPPPQFQPLRFMSPLGQLSDGYAGDLGLSSYATANDQMGFHGGSSFLGIEPWKLQQFPFLGGLDPAAAAAGVYQFHGGELGFLGGSGGEVRPKISSSLLSQMASVKMEDSQNPNLRQLLGGMQGNGNDEHWNSNVAGNGGANWTELSNFSSSSTSNPLQ